MNVCRITHRKYTWDPGDRAIISQKGVGERVGCSPESTVKSRPVGRTQIYLAETRLAEDCAQELGQRHPMGRFCVSLSPRHRSSLWHTQPHDGGTWAASEGPALLAFGEDSVV